MLRGGKIPDRGGVWIDAYNQSTCEDIAGTITTRIDHSNHYWVTDVKQIMEEPRPIQVAQIYDREQNPINGRVYSEDGIAPTLRTPTGGLYEPKIMKIGSYVPNGLCAGQVVDADGIAPTVMENHGMVTAVAEPVACSLRGRNADNPSDRRGGIPTEQRLEMGGGVANCLTSVQKDSMVAEPLISVHPLSHALEFKGEDSIKGISPALRATDYKCPHCVYEPREPSGCYDNQSGEFARKPVEGLARTVKTDHHNAVMLKYRIRKLCPIETGRLMGLTDEDFYKMANAKIPQVLKSGKIKYRPMGKSALYRLHGNSIVVDVLCHIFRCMFIPNQPEYDKSDNPTQLSLFPEL